MDNGLKLTTRLIRLERDKNFNGFRFFVAALNVGGFQEPSRQNKIEHIIIENCSDQLICLQRDR